MIVHADVDAVLTTTRSVRRRIDFSRTVDRALIEECLELALQAPSGANRQDWRYIAIDDGGQRAAVADVYRACFRDHYGDRDKPSAAGKALPSAVFESAQFLADKLQDVPVIVVPARSAVAPTRRSDQASFWASILPAAWSFMLAARSRGLVTSYTARGLDREADLAAVLGLPFPEVTQAGLIAVGHPDTQSFKPAKRCPLGDVLTWNTSG
jgi:nitroreductase